MHLGILNLISGRKEKRWSSQPKRSIGCKGCVNWSATALLRSTLAALPAGGRDQEWKDEVVRLLSEVVLFRLSLDQETVLSSFKNN